jgi:hypothetical protein
MCSSHVIGLFPSVAVACGNTGGSMTLGGLPLQLYTCGECGFAELYLDPPVTKWKKAPVQHGLEFNWVRPPPPADGPYR